MIPIGCSRSSGTASASRRSSTVTASGCGPAANRTPRATRVVPRSAHLAQRRAGDRRRRGHRSRREWRTRFRPPSGADQGEGRGRRADPFVYEVFDLLHLDGRSLLEEPLEERRRLLAGVLRPDPRVRLSEHIEADGIAFFEAARKRSLEGMMAKDRRSRTSPELGRWRGRRSRSVPSRSSWSVAG